MNSGKILSRSPRVFGIWATIVWGVLVVLYSAPRIDTILVLKPNEFGDFLAGVFAPLAFLWIIVSFLQHSNELAIQVEELTEQVKATKQMANVANSQANREIAEAQPLFVRSQTSNIQNGKKVSIQNIGARVVEVKLGETIGNIEVISIPPISVWDRGKNFSITLKEEAAGWFELCYNDYHGAPRRCWIYYDGRDHIKSRPYDTKIITDMDRLQEWLKSA